MPNVSILMKPETLREVAFGDITSNYTDFGDPLAFPSVLFHIINNTDANIYISLFEGIDHFYIPAGTFVIYDVSSNKGIGGDRSFAQNTQVQLKDDGSAASSGIVTLTSLYGSPRR